MNTAERIYVASTCDGEPGARLTEDLARRLEIKTVAEWVQDEESAVMLREWGCDYIQGRLIGLASSQRPWDKRAETVLPAAS